RAAEAARAAANRRPRGHFGVFDMVFLFEMWMEAAACGTTGTASARRRDIGLLARRDRKVEPVFGRRQRAGRIRGKGAGRVVGAVEVERQPALRIRRGG